jgi:hypothetical protein
MAQTWERHITFGNAALGERFSPQRALGADTSLLSLLSCTLRIALRMGTASYT